MPVHSGELRLSTRGDGDIVDITAGVAARRRRRPGSPRASRRAFVRGSTAAVTTMEYEPGGVARPAGAARPPDPAGGRLRAQPAQPRHQLARPPARIADRPLARGPGRRRPARARHLAAARADRLRRPPARADGPRPGGQLTGPGSELDRRRRDRRGAWLVVAALAIAGVFSGDEDGEPAAADFGDRGAGAQRRPAQPAGQRLIVGGRPGRDQRRGRATSGSRTPSPER